MSKVWQNVFLHSGFPTTIFIYQRREGFEYPGIVMFGLVLYYLALYNISPLHYGIKGV